MTQSQLENIVRQAAEAHGIDPALACAVVHHESANWKQWSCRYEPGFYERYISKMPFSFTEKTMRSTSFGLFQVMGQVAREFGFTGDYLTELLDPLINAEFGCRKLARELKKANGDVRKALLAYNGGGDPDYPDKVLRHLETYKL